MSSKKLTGKVAVVTGASKGIGAEIAKQLAAEGAAVVVNYSSSKSGADKVVEEITRQGGRAVAVQGRGGRRNSRPAVADRRHGGSAARTHRRARHGIVAPRQGARGGSGC